MLIDDAQRLASAIEERVTGGPAIKAAVEPMQMSPSAVPRGAGRPTFVRYNITLSDGARTAVLTMPEAEEVLADLESGCGPDQLFAVVAHHEIVVAADPS